MTTKGWLLLLLLAGIVIRGGFWFVYEPVSHPDTETYVTVAEYILRGDFTGYEGRRTPGYPAVIALAGLSPQAVWMLQMVAGLGISALLFSIALELTGRPAFAALVGMTYNLNLAQLFFEANLLSETTSTLTIVGTVAVLLRAGARLRRGQPVFWLLVTLGALAGVTTLTRPQFVFLPLLLASLVVWASWVTRPRRLIAIGRGCLVLIPGLLMIVAWSSFNYARVGFFTLTTQLGIGLMAQSLPFVESAPARYATIRDIYIKHRDAKIAETGRHNAEWDAIPELRAKTGLSLPALNNELQQMSIALFARHPFRYAGGVARAWMDFWLVPNYWRLQYLHPQWLATPLRGIWRLEQLFVRLFNATFLLLLAVAMWSRAFRLRTGWLFGLTSIAVVILASSIVPALSFWGENARYAIPVQALVIVVVLTVAHGWLGQPAASLLQREPATLGHQAWRQEGGTR